MENNHYHNSVPEKGKDLIEYEEKAMKQDEVILKIFETNPSRTFTPFNVQDILRSAGHDYPITSVRRAITNLTKAGKLAKVSIHPGIYGRNNNTWGLNFKPTLF